MISYIIRRILIVIPTVLIITFLVFSLLNFAPGNPLMSIVSKSPGGVSNELIETYKNDFNLDKPFLVRYGSWLWQIMQGNFGYSMISYEPVSQIVSYRIVNSFQLMIGGLIIATLLGIIIGIISGIYQYSIFDYVSSFFSFFALSIPKFFFGYLGILIFAIYFPWFPVGGSISPEIVMMENPSFFQILVNKLHHLVLPTLVLSLAYIAVMARFTRASILEVAQKQYVTTARAKGLKEKTVIMKHIFRNALSPVITLLSSRIRMLIAGSIGIEVVFQYPGIGKLLRDSVLNRDYNVILTIILLYSLVCIFSYLLADIAYSIADPRIRYN